MSRLTIEASSLRDTRFVRLARLLSLPGGRWEARGRLEEAWWLCMERGTYTLAPIDTAIAMGLLEEPPQANGKQCLADAEAQVADALVEADLADWSEVELLIGEHGPIPGRQGQFLRFRGGEGRLDWLEKKRAAGSKGGKVRAKRAAAQAAKQTAQAKPKQCLPRGSKQNQASGSGSGSGSGSSPPSEERDVSPRGATPPTSGPEPPKVEGYQETVQHFDERYRAAHGGAKPTWGARQGKLLKGLLKTHGAAEVQRRINVLFDAAPAWLDGRDIGTLAQHFDKLAQPTARTGAGPPARGGGTSRAAQINAFAEELARRGR